MQKIKEKLLDALEQMEFVDAHEHLAPESERLKMNVSVFNLFSHYTGGDLKRAGMTEEAYCKMQDTEQPLESRWKEFAPFWPHIRHTCYSRSALYSLKKFYGYDDINEKNYREISSAMEQDNKPGIYRRILRDTCHIRVALTQCSRTDVDTGNDRLLAPVMPMLLNLPPEMTWENIAKDSYAGNKYVNLNVQNLDDLLEKNRQYLLAVKSQGAVGVKTIAYPHLFPFKEPDRKEALDTFSKLKQGRLKKTSYMNPLFTYLYDRALDFVAETDLTVAVHTGYWDDFRKLSPLYVIPYLQRHPGTKFDIYHLGYPWLRETIMLAKEFSNAWLNFCWLHIISQQASCVALNEAIEMIPTNKIIAFGGDYLASAVEKIYGHLSFAKENIAEVLAGKINQAWFGYDEAVALMKKFFHDNPAKLYNL